MTICGFNDQIGEGVTTLVEGMIVAMRSRGMATGRGMTELVEEELVDLETLTGVLEKKGAVGLFGMFRGLNILASAFFELVQKDMRGGQTFDVACRAAGKRFNALLEQAELMHLELRKGNPSGSSILAVAEWVVEQEP